MNQDELIQLLSAHEWTDVEFKEARQAVPKNAYETVSAFSNTAGGHLVFGVKKDGIRFEVVGVLDVDKVQNEFVSTLRQKDKISLIINVEEQIHNIEGKDLLIFYVPEATRAEKPVFLNKNVSKAFIRKGGADVHCSPEEIQRFNNDASADRYDGQIIEFDLQSCFDATSISWYRNIYERKPGNRSYADKNDIEFLFELGLIRETQQGWRASRAAILLFGRDGSFRDIMPRPVADCQRFRTAYGEYTPGARWDDRVVLDFNLIRAWQSLLDWYQKVATTPFRLDPATMQRTDMPPDYIAFREAVINVLIHQDYADHSRKPEIRHFADRTIFWNPGDAFASFADLLEPGEKEVRNPRIVTAFRRIGLSENAGWGLRDVFTNWQQLGNVPPVIHNDKALKTFQLVLPKELLLSEEQIMFQAQLGVHLDPEAARLFAYICRKKEITVADAKAVLAQSTAQSLAKLKYLVNQALIKELEPESFYGLAEHLLSRFPSDQPSDQAGGKLITLPTSTAQAEAEAPAIADLSTASAQVVTASSANLCTQPTDELVHLTPLQREILSMCEVPQPLAELQKKAAFGNRGYFKRTIINSLIGANLLRMTKPDKPTARDQKYLVTEGGLRLVLLGRKKA